jgi:hypothetical protein
MTSPRTESVVGGRLTTRELAELRSAAAVFEGVAETPKAAGGGQDGKRTSERGGHVRLEGIDVRSVAPADRGSGFAGAGGVQDLREPFGVVGIDIAAADAQGRDSSVVASDTLSPIRGKAA